jgi:ComF family protein
MKKNKLFQNLTLPNQTRRLATEILNGFLEIFFPNHCLACEEIINRDAAFCDNCWPQLKFITEPKCKICSYPFEIEIKQMRPFCASCLAKKPAFDEVISIYRYNKIIGRAVSDLKYRDQTFVAKKFAKILKNKAINEIEKADFICPIPLHPKRLKFRKFNQALLIAKFINKDKLIGDLIWRVNDSEPQVNLKKKDREKNLKRAFLVNKKFRDQLRGKNVILIDDVITTGATAENCAKALKKCGVEKITVLTIAKTVFD